MEVIELHEQHWEDAARLTAGRVHSLRRELSCLPERYQRSDTILELIRNLAPAVPGVAALHKGRLIGYLLGMTAPNLRGGRGVCSPEWANAAEPEDARSIYQAMYAALAPRWLANAQSALDALYWQGFGLMVVDAIRDLAPLNPSNLEAPGLEIRRATVADAGILTQLTQGLQRHLASSPIFLALTALEDESSTYEWLAQPHNVTWLALSNGQAIGEMGFGPSNPTACTIMRDELTTSIMSAYTLPDARSSGVARALLDAGLANACSEGCARCAVDFESQNIVGAGFWLRHFRPICYSVLRIVDPRITYAHAGRALNNLW